MAPSGWNADTSWSTLDCARQCWNFAGDATVWEPLSPASATSVVANKTSRSGSATGSGLSNTVLTNEKIADVAPIPSASAVTAVIVKPGLLRNMRTECFTSLRIASIADHSLCRIVCREQFVTGQPSAFTDLPALGLTLRSLVVKKYISTQLAFRGCLEWWS